MDLPSILPQDLKGFSEASNDRDLFERLLNSTKQLAEFFSYASDDETWSSQHQEFNELVLAWFTRQYLQDKLGAHYLEDLVKTFQEHFAILGPSLPRPLEVHVGTTTFAASPLILGWMSPYFKSHIKKDEQRKSVFVLNLFEAELDLVKFALQFLETGSADGIWKFEKKQVIELMNMAEKWRTSRLSEECQELLKRYVTEDNVEKELVKSYQKGRWKLLERCFEILNNKYKGGRVFSDLEGVISFEFYHFDETGLHSFEVVKELITYLHFKGDLTLDEKFKEVMQQCPRLIGLTWAETNAWSPYFEFVPARVYDLDVSQCAWLGDRELRLLASSLPRISSLKLAQNTQVTYRGFSELKNFHGLKTLSLERCSQLDDEALRLILQGSPGIVDLSLYGCRKLSDAVFYEMGRRIPGLQKINLARTTITDGAFIDIALRCNDLSDLVLDHCVNISLGGLYAVFKQAKNLKTVSIQENRIDGKALDALRLAYPGVHINL